MDPKTSSAASYTDSMKLNIVKLCVMSGPRMTPSCSGVRLICVSIFDIAGVILKEVTITFPANNQEILEKIKETLDEGTRLALFSHIPSNYPVVMPVEEMVKLCHNKGVPVLIDGAHALGSLPLDLGTLKADYYVSNAHKWLSCPKVCHQEVYAFR